MEKELDKVQAFVEKLFQDCCPSDFLYHNLQHTREVVKHAREIAEYYNLNQNEQFILLSAAWFHDSGQLFGEMQSHEETGVSLMKEFFVGEPVDEETIKGIETCILATKMPVKPKTLLEKIICDADTYHLGTPDFAKLDRQVWAELERRLGVSIADSIGKSILFLKEHRFFTSYCQKRLSEGKTQNLLLLESLKNS